jgi:hypothetical protein
MSLQFLAVFARDRLKTPSTSPQEKWSAKNLLEVALRAERESSFKCDIPIFEFWLLTRISDNI